jgi:Tfp pilus assembly protein PilO
MSRLATIIICFLLSSIIAFFLLWPEISKYSDFSLKIRAKDIELKNQEKYFSQVRDKAEKLKGYQEELAKVDSALPNYPSLPAVLEFLVQVGSQNGIIINKIISTSVTASSKQTKSSSTQPEPGIGIPGNLKEISIEFEVSGDYNSLKSFLSTLEKNARLIEVESISLTSKQNTKETLPSFILKIKTHSF